MNEWVIIEKEQLTWKMSVLYFWQISSIDILCSVYKKWRWKINVHHNSTDAPTKVQTLWYIALMVSKGSTDTTWSSSTQVSGKLQGTSEERVPTRETSCFSSSKSLPFSFFDGSFLSLLCVVAAQEMSDQLNWNEKNTITDFIDNHIS